MLMNQDTIVAITTAPGAGAIGVIRLSGPAAVAIGNQIFKGKDLSREASHTLHFGKIVAPPAAAQPNNNAPLSTNESELIDEVVAALFLAPKSYTGEDIVEISAHGSSYILNRVLSLCISHGARLAGPGEFTQRAFLNGKMDLAQAEAVADLIASENKAAHDLAMNQMRGGVSSELSRLREQLVNFTALIELELDFSDEDVEFADRAALKDLISNLKSQISNLIESFEYGNAIKNGVPVAIIGKPNAGKSTLLNALLKEERAIVSDVAGTTRDAIEEAITLDGITFRFIDTAGIRETNDAIEAIGVQRAKEKAEQAKVVIHLYEDDQGLLDELTEHLQDKIVFNLLSKCDVNKKEDNSLISNISNLISFPISVKTGINMDKLSNALVSYFKNSQSQSSVIITNVRHKEALGKAFAALEEVENGMQMNLSGDLLSLHLKDALYHIGAITGKIDVDKDVLGAIFGRFCIGK